jgi:hypothetical protein
LGGGGGKKNGGGIPGLGGSPNRNRDVDDYYESPRAESGVPELGGNSDLLYNDDNIDPAHGGLISADQLDRLMLRQAAVNGDYRNDSYDDGEW